MQLLLKRNALHQLNNCSDYDFLRYNYLPLIRAFCLYLLTVLIQNLLLIQVLCEVVSAHHSACSAEFRQHYQRR